MEKSVVVDLSVSSFYIKEAIYIYRLHFNAIDSGLQECRSDNEKSPTRILSLQILGILKFSEIYGPVENWHSPERKIW